MKTKSSSKDAQIKIGLAKQADASLKIVMSYYINLKET